MLQLQQENRVYDLVRYIDEKLGERQAKLLVPQEHRPPLGILLAIVMTGAEDTLARL